MEVCSTVPLDINGSLAGILDFGEDIMSEAGSDSGGISSHDGSKNDTDSDYNTEPSIKISQEIVIVKLTIIIKWLGTIFE